MEREELFESVLEINRVSERLTVMKLEIKGSILNIASEYAPQDGICIRRKMTFWQDLDGLIESVSKQERIVLSAYLNRHVGKGNIGMRK